MTTIQLRNVVHVSSADAFAEVGERYGLEEISDETAATLAALWQSPGTVGSVLAALASGAPVTVSDLLDDIYATHQGVPKEDRWDRIALDMLSSWALNYHRTH